MARSANVTLLLVAAALLSAACAGGSGEPGPRDAKGQPVTVAERCVQTYSPETIVERSFSFDGTVVAIERRTDPRLPEGEDRVPWVTFRVDRWFRGGSASQVGVWIDGLNIETSVGTIEAKHGTRLLVAGEPRWGGDPLDDPIAWACGFTQPWTPEIAAEWKAAFRG